MSLWRKVDQNPDTTLWEATCPDGRTPLRVTGQTAPPDWMVKHHTDRFGNNPPKTELGQRGHRYLFPDETTWREYGFTPKGKP